jgi:collagenase-like PrtC family protease
MKILSPLDSPSEVEPLIEAGAGEFYCGVLEESWHKPYPVISINRRPAGKGHLRNFAELAEAVAISHRNDIPVFFTVNEHYYTKPQLPLVKDYIDRACDAGVDAFIIADYGLLHLLREGPAPPAIHISTGGTVFNWRTARFYRELGATRITLPRHLSLDEMKRLVAHVPDLETTVFVFNSRCINVDGFCTFQHGLSGRQTPAFYRNACMLPYEITPIPLTAAAAEEPAEDIEQLVSRQRVWEKVHLDDYPCAACALYEFKEMGTTSIKIVGRGNTTVRKTTDVSFFKNLLNCLCGDRTAGKDFREYARALYNRTYRRTCRPFMCHYPSVME